MKELAHSSMASKRLKAGNNWRVFSVTRNSINGRSKGAKDKLQESTTPEKNAAVVRFFRVDENPIVPDARYVAVDTLRKVAFFSNLAICRVFCLEPFSCCWVKVLDSIADGHRRKSLVRTLVFLDDGIIVR